MIRKYKDISPLIHESCFVADSADVIGEVTAQENVSIWFGAVLRADVASIQIGKGSNVQDNCVFHVSHDAGLVIGENVTIGHGAILHSCKIGNNCLIGMGSIILDGAEIGDNTLIGAGSLVAPNKKIPSGVLCLGSPAKVVRELSEEEINEITASAEHYIEIAKEYK